MVLDTPQGWQNCINREGNANSNYLEVVKNLVYRQIEGIHPPSGELIHDMSARDIAYSTHCVSNNMYQEIFLWFVKVTL